MLRTEYFQAKESLLQNFSKGFRINENEQLNGQFTLISAGLSNYLPSISFQQHEEIFKTLLLHKKLSALEQGSSDALALTTIEDYTDEIEDILKNKAAIICTFHTGSYRLINLYLAKKGIPFSLVIGKEVMNQEGGDFLSLYKDNSCNKNGFRIIDAEDPHSALQMLRQLKSGNNLMIYLDGNVGAGNQTIQNDNNCLINFLEQKIYARKGVGYLAHAAGVPIIPVVCYRKSWSDIYLKFFNPIYPNSDFPRNEYAEKITQFLYDLVSPFIIQYPEQWEAWLYLHKIAHIINHEVDEHQNKKVSFNRPEQVLFNAERFGLYKISGRPFLFQKSTYFSYPIDRELYQFLGECISKPIGTEKIDEHLFNDLLGRRVLIIA
ncbi:MAG TPA: hypothetical protein VF487_13635 [Chitinophagaceae bacterium]